MNSVIRNILLVGSGGIIAQGINALSTPIITRLFTPESYGQWALLIGMAAVFGEVSVLRYELAIVLPKSHKKAANLFVLCCILAVIIGLCSTIVLGFSRETFLKSAVDWWWVVPILVCIIGIYLTCISWFTRMQDFSFFSLATVLLPLSICSIQIILALSGIRNLNGLIIGSVLGQAIAVGIMGSLILIKYRELIFRSFSWQITREMSVQFKNYPIYMTPYTLVGIFTGRIVIFILNFLGASSQAGYYMLADRIVQFPVSFLSSAVKPVFFQKASVSKFSDLEDVINRAMNFINKITTPFFVLFLFKSSDIFSFVFGEKWHSAGIFASILSVRTFFVLHRSWMDRGMDVLRRQKTAFNLETFFSLLSIIVLIFGLVVLNDIMYGILLQNIVFALYSVIWIYFFFELAHYSQRRLARLGFLGLLRFTFCYLSLLILTEILSQFWAYSCFILSIIIYLYVNLKNEWIQLKTELDSA